MKKLFVLLITCLLAFSFIFALSACGQTKSNVKLVNIKLTDEQYAFGVDKNNPELLSQLNIFLQTIKTNGEFDKILNNYFGDGEPIGITSAEENTSHNQIIVATNAEFAPFEYLDGNTYYGVDLEIAYQFSKYLNKELVIKNVDFDAVCTTVSSGYADIAMAGLTIKESRKEFVTFSDPYYNASQMLIALEGDKTFDLCASPEDVEKILATFDKKTVIGVQGGTTGQLYLEGDSEWEFAGFDVTCKGYSSGSLAVIDMINGNISYVIIDEAPAYSIVNSINKK